MGRLALAALVAVLAVSPAAAQARPQVRVGWLGVAPEPAMAVFRQILREHGWVEGETLVIEERYPERGDYARIPGLAADLVNLRVDVIVAVGNSATGAAQKATQTVPVVFSTSEPVERAFVASLSRPAGNLTGVASLAEELNVKRLEILRETLPRITRVGVLHRPTAAQRQWVREMESAARRLGLQVVPVEIVAADDIERAASVFGRKRVTALVPLAAPFFRAEKERLLRLAARLRIPAIYEDRDLTEAGGLMSYGPDRRDTLRRVAALVDRVLRGAKPAEIPVEQVMRIEFVINEKTARTLGIAFSPQVLSRTDEVIR